MSELWRYPVKSLAGERCESLELNDRGVVGDRAWALVDPERKIASGKTTRRFRRVDGLLRHRAWLDGDGEPVLDLAGGRSAGLTDEVAEELAGPGWRFARETDIPHFDAGAVHIVTTATLESLGAADGARVEVERLRPNILVDADEREEAWIGRMLRIGVVELEVTGRVERCVMVGLEQVELPKRPRLLRTIGEWNAFDAGVYASVVRPGRISVRDAVTIR